MYRSLVPLHEIAIWPVKTTTPTGQVPQYSLLEIAETIMKLYAPEAAPQTKAIDQRCREAAFGYKMSDQLVEEKHLLAYLELVENNYLGQECLPEQNDKLAKELYKKLPKNTGMAKLFTEHTIKEIGGGLDTVEKASLRIKGLLSLVRQSIRIATSYGPDNYDYRIDSRDKEITNSSSSSSSYAVATTPPASETTRSDKRLPVDIYSHQPYVERCECCGNYGHSTTRCRWATHALVNNSAKSWKNSHVATIWAKVGSDSFKPNKTIPGYDIIKKNDYLTLNNEYNRHQSLNNPPNKRQKVSANYKGSNPKPFDQLYNSQTSSSNSNPSANTQRSKSIPKMICSIINDTTNSEYLNVTVTKCKQITTQGLRTAQPTIRSPGTNPPRGITEVEAQQGLEKIVETKALLDTGSLPGNFLSMDLLHKIDGSDSLYKTDQPMRVCSGLDNHCIDSLDVVDVLVSFKVKNKKMTIPLTCRISTSGNIDLIIGRTSIKQHKLVSLLPKYIFKEDGEYNERDNNPYRQTNCPTAPYGCDIVAKVATLANGPHNGLNSILVGSGHHSRNTPTHRVHFDDIPLIGTAEVASPLDPIDTPSKTWGTVATILKQNEQLSEVDLIVSDEIDSDIKDTFGPF